MSPLDYSKTRIEAVLAEIGRLKESEFPYPYSWDALIEIEKLLKERLNALDGIPVDRDPATIRKRCAESLLALFRFLPLLGFLLRSTNVRNAFEVYGPLLRLSRQVLGDRIKLIISSEWESYSPFLRPVNEMKDFVLIGFPAPESGNPLLIPLAGHELGHAVWNDRMSSEIEDLKQKVQEKIFTEIERRLPEYKKIYPGHKAVSNRLNTNRRVIEMVGIVRNFALRQAEEYFCDFVGLYIFDEAYLHAVAYVLSPTILMLRSVSNSSPPVEVRVAKLIEASNLFREYRGGGYVVPRDYSCLFEMQPEPKTEQDKLIVSLVDSASSHITNDLMQFTHEVLSTAKLPKLSDDVVKETCASYKFAIPHDKADNLTNILSAAWRVYHDKDFWGHLSQVESSQKVLKELVLKNIEVLEIQQIRNESL